MVSLMTNFHLHMDLDFSSIRYYMIVFYLQNSLL